ncbi:MAG: HRDC domain-containing protein [Anaerolineae bacterium]|nr:HRDC domain-containing protein [Anaerolineae bacterium]
MRLDQLPKPIFVANPDSLQQMIDDLAEQSIIAVDTEANSLYAYRERVCLIQFSTPESDYLLDTLALQDLSSLAPVFSNPKIEKVFHAAEYDIIILRHDFDFSFSRIFDTMVAARILGWNAVGLGSLLASEFGIHANKKYQRADWGRRPLPQEMLTYAQMDTHFLIALRNQMKTALKARKRWDLALEDFKRSCYMNGHSDRTPGDVCWRIKGASDLQPQQAAVLRELCIYRDLEARAINRPLFKVIGNQVLIELSKIWPSTIKQIQSIQGISPRQAHRLGPGILAAIQRGQQTEPPRVARSPRRNNAHLDRIDRLRNWRKNKAKNLGVQSDIILPKDILHKIAAENPSTGEKLASVMDSLPWRFGRFGDEILKQLMSSK